MSEVISLREKVAQAELAAGVRLQFTKTQEHSSIESEMAPKAERPRRDQKPKKSERAEF